MTDAVSPAIPHIAYYSSPSFDFWMPSQPGLGGVSRPFLVTRVFFGVLEHVTNYGQFGVVAYLIVIVLGNCEE